MRYIAVPILALLVLSACREETVDAIVAVDMPADTLGYYCRMPLADHEGPKGQIHLEGREAPIYFAQVRDTLGYLHMPEQSHAVRATFVQDMAGAASWRDPAGWIAASAAFYVVGSDRTGGMGAPEYVPFSDVGAARQFIEAHGGRVIRFEEITAADVLNDGGPSETGEGSDIAMRLQSLSRDHAHD